MEPPGSTGIFPEPPPATRKTVDTENIIAVSAETGPDRSAQALLKTLNAIKHFADDLEEQHSEW